MGNIPLQTGGQFINPAQKRGVSPGWNNQSYEYAKSIIEGFNAMGQQVGGDLVRIGKHLSKQSEEEDKQNERESVMKDAHSISLLKIRQGEDFSSVEKTIESKEYKTVEEFDADWNEALLPELDEMHENLMQNADIVWNRQRIQPQAQRAYEVAREQFRVKARANVDARVTQRRQENAAKALSVAGANADIASIMAGRDAAVSAGIDLSEVEDMTRNAMFEAFSVTQRANMEKNGGTNSTKYKIAMHNALSTSRDNISENIRAILNAEDEKIFDAWKAGDFSEIIEAPSKNKKAKVSSTKPPEDQKNGVSKIGTNWEAARQAGREATEEAHRIAVEDIERAQQEGIITPEQARSFLDAEDAVKQEALRQIDANILAQRASAAKEQRNLVKALIGTAATSEEAFLEYCTNVQYSGNAAVNFNEKINWMRERHDSEYDAAKSRAALLRIYANAGRLKDEADSDGSYRLSALALARKNCNAGDYAKAISFLAGGDKDSASQGLIENGIAKVFDAVGLSKNDMKSGHLDPDEEGELVAYCGDVVRLAGNLPPAAFRHEIEGMCIKLKELQGERARIRYLESYMESATRDIASLETQQRAQYEFEPASTEAVKALVEADKKREENKAKADKDRERQEASAREILKRSNYQTTIGMPGMTGNLLDFFK